jgi:hypothetical protein
MYELAMMREQDSTYNSGNAVFEWLLSPSLLHPHTISCNGDGHNPVLNTTCMFTDCHQVHDAEGSRKYDKLPKEPSRNVDRGFSRVEGIVQGRRVPMTK